MTLVEMLERHAREFPRKLAVVSRCSKMNYRQFNALVNRLASVLIERGLRKGDRVSLLLPRTVELVVSFLAILKARGIVVPVNFELPSKQVRAIWETVSPECLIVHRSFLDLARKSMPRVSEIPIILVGDGGSAKGCLSWDEILTKGNLCNPSLTVNDDDVVYLNYTSGSTGSPKGAITTHANIYWNTLAAVDALGLTPDDVHLCMFAPFAHPHEIIARPLYLGGTMVLVDKIYPKSVAGAISNHKITCMMAIAPVYESLLEAVRHNSYELGSLRIPESGGMYTSPELVERFRKEVGRPIIPVWGSTETTGIALANRPGENIVPGSVGKPCASYEVKIVKENGVEVPPGSVGEMVFKSLAVVQSYYRDPTTSRSCFRNGWYYSGDLGRKDEEGNFYFVARKDEMMKVAGLKVYPLEIEQVSMKHPGIKEVVVVPVKNKMRGEVPKAFVIPKDGAELAVRELLRFWRETLPAYKVPRMIEIRESLPRTPGSGKLCRKLLRSESV